MSTAIEIIRHLVHTNAARLVAWSSLAATAGAVWLAGRLGVELSPEILVGLGSLAALVATELIRRLVYSTDTTQAIADRAAGTGNTNIGSPPSGDLN